MKKTYIKPAMSCFVINNTHLMNASFGKGNADSGQPVLSKRDNIFLDDDLDIDNDSN